MDFSVQLPLLNAGFMPPLPDDPDSWCTDSEIVEPLREFGRVRLDPFSNPRSIIDADIAWDITHGDLTETESWDFGGLVYANWPYSQNLRWARKTAYEGQRVESIALCQAYVGARWFQRHVMQARLVCLPDHRIAFRGSKGTPPWDSAIPYWGSRPDRFIRAFKHLGPVIDPRDIREK